MCNILPAIVINEVVLGRYREVKSFSPPVTEWPRKILVTSYFCEAAVHHLRPLFDKTLLTENKLVLVFSLNSAW